MPNSSPAPLTAPQWKLRLRALELSDLEMLYQLENDPAMASIATSHTYYSHYALKQFIRRAAQEDIYATRQLRLVAEIADESKRRAVGLIDLTDFSPEHRRAEIGIVILPDFRKQGLGCAALKLLARHAVSALSLHQLYAYVAEDNTPSHRLFRRLGYRHTAVLTDWILHGKSYKNAHLYQKTL